VIQLFCPSRGRPEAAAELQKSFLATKEGDSELIFLLDWNDPRRNEYALPVVIGEPTGDPTGPLNRAALSSAAPIVGFIGDDSRCETPGWDRMVEAALLTPGFCWGSDGHDKPWPSTCFVSSSIVKALGFMVPPVFRRGFFDVYWIDLSMASSTARVIPAMFRHDNSKGFVDPEIIAADERAYQHWREGDIRGDVQKVRSVQLAPFFS
jgi:hypothetical protein